MKKFIIVLIFLGSAVAQADSRYPHQCTGDFDVQVNQYNSVRFDDEILLPIKVQAFREGRPCIDSLIFSAVDNGPFKLIGEGGVQLDATLLNTNRKPLPVRTVDGRRSWIVDYNGHQHLNLWLRIDAHRVITAGAYAAALVVQSKDGRRTLMDKVVDLGFYMPAVVSIQVARSHSDSVRGHGGHYQVDLGSLNDGARADWRLKVFSNSLYDVSIYSEDRALVHQQDTSSRIPYEILFDGNRFPATTTYQRSYQQSYSGKRRFDMGIVVDDVKYQRAGRYQDTVYVTVTAR
ncbi:MAG: hypothetical protein CMF12_00055 [Idiomarina sp.]|jgi:hypothetical protein|uniref:hypothetical protein n=1 Tax=Idiomarina sp. TaxID=1874361 RepID=UPI000C5B2BDC|nr:hypothetical protein [Idiomarina sp.]MBT40893.1 hypothetical protein [Idiomarina sp.]